MAAKPRTNPRRIKQLERVVKAMDRYMEMCESHTDYTYRTMKLSRQEAVRLLRDERSGWLD